VNMLYALLVGLSLSLGLAFVLTFGNPSRSDNPPMAWLQAALAWVAVAFDALLFLALFHVVPPAWAILGVLLAQDAVFAWRLIVLFGRRSLSRR